MSGVFAGSRRAVVAAGTTCRYRTVIEGHRGPVRRHMAIVTGVGTLNMSG